MMGIRHLDSFIRQTVPNGCFEVNIENKIREYYKAATESNPLPKPIIVIDLMALYSPLGEMDVKSLLLGGRVNLAYTTIDHFFTRLKTLGVTLEFFLDGTVQSYKLEVLCERKDQNYQKMIEIVDAVEQGTDIETIRAQHGAFVPYYAIQCIAKKHGTLTISMAKECDQELAAFACKTKAIAIISDDSDFLIYDGDWRYWSAREMNICTLETLEYNRQALIEHLELSYAQMPLFATLCGNDIVKFEEVQSFHFRLGQFSHKFYNVANFVRQQPTGLPYPVDLQNVLKQVFGLQNEQMKTRFQQSLDVYKTNYTAPNPNPNNDPVLAVLLEHGNPFMYQVWFKQPYAVLLGFVDLRQNDLGQQLPGLVLQIVMRSAGIILYHRLKRRRFYASPLVVKLDHESNYAQRNFPVQFPTQFEVPTLVDLISGNPTTSSADLLDIKLKLLCWIVSDSLDCKRVKSVLGPYAATVLTLYLLVEKGLIEIFEADLLLQVAYDVVAETYDPLAQKIPDKVESRPFRLVLFYKSVFRFVCKAIYVVGLNLEGSLAVPPFDGVLFQNRYAEWAKDGGDLKDIEHWRIYATI